MRIRYARDEKGHPIKQALIYTPNDHGIDKNKIDHDALKIIKRLQKAGYQAYIVGGAIRDLIQGKTPKDFDLVTDAFPSQVRRLFRNSRIIGNRFRLVHVYFVDNKIIEVATFRALASGDKNNIFGTMEEDVKRRDFTLNALYYDPDTESIIDYVHGLRDIKKKILKSVLPLKTTFKEDPVRMIRAIKYSVTTGVRITHRIKKSIRKNAVCLADCSTSRMSEELFKILQSGYSAPIMRCFYNLKLLGYFLPEFNNHLQQSESFNEDFFKSLEKLDYLILNRKEKRRSRMLLHLLDPYLTLQNSFMNTVDKRQLFKGVIKDSKSGLRPLIAPNAEVEEAVKMMFRRKKINFPKKRSIHGRNKRFVQQAMETKSRKNTPD